MDLDPPTGAAPALVRHFPPPRNDLVGRAEPGYVPASTIREGP
jgi:hypothetical protein